MSKEVIVHNTFTRLQGVACIGSGALLLTESMHGSETKLLAYLTHIELNTAVSFFYILGPIAIFFLSAALCLFLGCMQGPLNKTDLCSALFPRWSVEGIFFDIAIKATILWFGVITREPALIPALLTLFTADWVLQRRFFRLSGQFSTIVGGMLYGDAVIRYLLDDARMLAPLAIFTLVSAVSTYQSITTKE